MQQQKVIPNDVYNIQNWADTWQMTFNIEKCKVLHAGNKMSIINTIMGDTEIEEGIYEKRPTKCSDIQYSKKC